MNFITTNILANEEQVETKFVDQRDNEIYDLVSIGEDVWMAQNLRFDMPGSISNPNYPNSNYGRLYTIDAAQEACPDGWHIATDREWNLLEIEHGMPRRDSLNSGWRGEHARAMMISYDWEDGEEGLNTLGFNVLPSGYHFNEKMAEIEGFEGLGYSAAFWSSKIDSIGQARFLFGVRKFVNKWPDTNNDSGASLSCRCVKDR